MSPNQPTPTTPTEARQNWLRRLAPIAVLSAGIAAALFAGARPAPEVAPDTASVQSAPPAQIASAARSDEPVPAGYRRSQFAGVMVRDVSGPAGTGGAANARYYIKSGTKRTNTSADSGYGGSTPTTANAVTLPNGQGVSRRIPSNLAAAQHYQKREEIVSAAPAAR